MAWVVRIENALHIDRAAPEGVAKTAAAVEKLADNIKIWFRETYPGDKMPKITPVPKVGVVAVDCGERVGRQLWKVEGAERVFRSDLPIYAPPAAAPAPR